MCFFYLPNVKRFIWNYIQDYRIYREFELNKRINPNQQIEWRGNLLKILFNNWRELISDVRLEWDKMNQVEISYIQPGKPQQNTYN